jgi:hypothetical protein
MGRVPKDKQVYYVSYCLDGKALDFYNQVVSKDERNWDLKRFFIELFEFCFPVDFRNAQRKQLNRCFQGQKSVAAHVAEWSHIWNLIGLEDTEEKIVKLFNSFSYAVQTEVYRKDIDPEANTWEEVVKAAEQAEVLIKLANRNQESKGASSKRGGSSQKRDESQPQNKRGGFRGRGRGRGGRQYSPRSQEEVLRTSSAALVERPGKSGKTGELSAERKAEMIAKGLCFNCGEAEHMARNCPKKRIVPSKKKGKPPGLQANAVQMSIPSGSSSRDALHESTQGVLETFALRFNSSGVQEGGEPLQAFSDSENDFDLISDVSSDLGVESVGENTPIGDIYAMHVELMLQNAQPYPGDNLLPDAEGLASEKRFLVYLFSDTEYIVSDSAHLEGIVLSAELLRDADFMPALWYAQMRAEELGLNSDETLA